MLLPLKAALAMTVALAVGADTKKVCRNATGVDQGYFYTFWHDSGDTCITLGRDGAYRLDWQLGTRGNLVAGRGWAKGSPDRTVRYTARTFEPGANGYLTLYGWSTAPLVEYYVVDDWGDFTPPGPGAAVLGTVASDGGVYRIYRTQRVNQPSIAGTATFYQYWSVRTAKRTRSGTRAISFANHVAAWRTHGLRLGKMDYQVLATEGFGSTGRSDISVAD